jgi:carbon monoxide dehydrogenase subunit G
MKVRFTREFDAPPDAVFPYLEEPDKIRQWMPGIVDDRQIGDGPMQVGSMFELDVREGRKVVTYRGEITAYQRDRRMGLRLVGGCSKRPLQMDVDYRLHPIDGARTRIDYTCEVATQGLVMRWMKPLLELVSRIVLRRFFGRLAGLVERPAPNPA